MPWFACTEPLSLQAQQEIFWRRALSRQTHIQLNSRALTRGPLFFLNIYLPRTICIKYLTSIQWQADTYPLSGSHALQFHLLQVGGSKRHVVINKVRDQGGGPVIFWQRKKTPHTYKLFVIWTQTCRLFQIILKQSIIFKMIAFWATLYTTIIQLHQ